MSWRLALVTSAGFACVFLGLGLAALIDGSGGTAAEWAGAVGVSAALALATFQWGRDRQDERNRQGRAQAEQIAVWVALDSVTDLPRADKEGRMPFPVRVANSSTLAAYDCVISDGVLGPDGMPIPGGMVHMGVLPPNQTVSLSFSLTTAVLEDPWLEIAFTDAAGRHWLRRQSELIALDSTPSQHYRFAEMT